jgi:hypothetical protein
MTDKSGVQIELAQLHTAIFNPAGRKLLKAGQQRFRISALVCLDVSGHHVDALSMLLLSGFQHRISLADASGRPEKYFVFAALEPGFFILYAGEKLVRIRSLIAHDHHAFSVLQIQFAAG